jgi:hypothetical protein
LKNGHLSIDSTAPSRTFAVEGMAPVVKLQSIPSNGVDPVTLQCGRLTPKAVYALPAQPSNLVTVSVFDQVDHDEPKLSEYRQKALATMQQAERDAVHAQPELQRLTSFAHAMLVNPDKESITATLGAANDVSKLMDKKFGCSSIHSSEPLRSAVCDEAIGLQLAIKSLQQSLPRVQDAAEDKRQKLLETENVAVTVTSLRPAPPITTAARRQQCGRIERYRWLDVPGVVDNGELVHDGGVTPAPGVYALGLRFMRRRNSNFLDGVGADAMAIVEHLSHQLDRRHAA